MQLSDMARPQLACRYCNWDVELAPARHWHCVRLLLYRIYVLCTRFGLTNFRWEHGNHRLKSIIASP